MLFFYQKEKIAGLAISDEAVGLLLFKKSKKPLLQEYKKEHGLERGIIQDGVLQDKKRFLKSLKQIVPPRLFHGWREPRKVVVSIPEQLVHYTSFLVPKSLALQPLEDTISSNLEKNSPLPFDQIIYDWEEHSFSDKQKRIQVAYVERGKIDDYLETIQKAGLHPVALEGEFLSIRRFLTSPPKGGRILLLLKPNRITSIILSGNIVSFSRTTGWEGTEKTLKKELLRIIEYYFTEHPRGPVIKELIVDAGENERLKVQTLETEIRRLLKITITELKFPSLETTSGALLGSALRGQVPRGKDKFISLMTPGTEELFHEAQVLLFSKIVNDFIIIISVILVIIFSLTSFYILPGFEKQKDEQIAIKRAQPATQEIAELEEEITGFNTIVEPLANIEGSSPDWVTPLRDITIRVRPGIQVTNISINLASSAVQLGGTAEDIGFMLDFKSALSFSGIYEGDLTIPFSSFEKDTGIPFTYTLHLKDRSILFPFKSSPPLP